MNREAIFAALFAKGQGIGFVSSSRRLRHIAEMEPAEFPALFQVQQPENWKQASGNLPPVGALGAEWWIYAQSSDPAVPISSLLNPLVDAACAALGLPPNVTPFGKQTLGGLIESLQLEGSIDWADGALDDRGFVRIPLVLKTLG